MKKPHPKWLQAKTISTNDIQNSSESNLSHSDTDVGKTDTSDPVKALKNIFFTELAESKKNGLYDEALACIQNIIEIQGVDSELLYEAAELYFLKEDYKRAANCLKSFRNINPRDCRGYLLQTQILLQTGEKNIALNLIDNFFQHQIKLNTDKQYQTFDQIIEKLKKIFKPDKLFRRLPQLENYQKKRRQILKSSKINKNSTTHLQNNSKDDSMVSNSTKINPPKKEVIVTQMKTKSELEKTNATIQEENILFTTISHIWDMQSANTQEKTVIINSSAEIINQAVLKQVISYKKKLWLYNYIADIFRQENKIDTSIYLLRQALVLDDENDLLLKNLGYLLYKKGEKKAAQVILEDITKKDFSTIELIELCSNA